MMDASTTHHLANQISKENINNNTLLLLLPLIIDHRNKQTKIRGTKQPLSMNARLGFKNVHNVQLQRILVRDSIAGAIVG
jgi:hypothetical protein